VWTSGRDSGIEQMTRSLSLLKTDHVELMQIHNLLDWRAHLPTLRAWKADKRIRYSASRTTRRAPTTSSKR
jgi:diketogulonate reductase-like aldo/keto reductase